MFVRIQLWQKIKIDLKPEFIFDYVYERNRCYRIQAAVVTWEDRRISSTGKRGKTLSKHFTRRL